ncbi:ABC-2 type transport system ATP-binding protein [Breznakia sp. PF5-3]|uniref:ABC transporter ATP-binding protein n=1 Tax=unclassified Breznakia TaxID=2623764 RepID=UPI002406C488|nr:MULTISPECIES: ABC transporter ATP-binding protein [unclassified Breznakia]MDF9825463.1 ABC-2 type transport system ATP-binding protein [Breznakia sp. PM6-1]MDF9836348.1 ABC-2 type transport system ATP-binding protein [Breznakia sp. PF5-3]MDF9838753.1 ABC-2 type transport system ATP-binding protein [Breznakia sp. PFB2-8]MDF9860785.1 ABC-2 type transport system ATP-binding protein [Breznakia sp. PH5-24]
MNAICVQQLSKIYPTGKKAVDNISFSIKEGEIFGFLGPNGAGKTTAVKLLTGLLQPSEGACSVDGYDSTSQPEHVHAISGVVTEHSQMYDHMSGFENLMFYSALFGSDKAEAKQHATKLLTQLDLLDAKDQKLATYSTGMRQRLSLARAMIHHPKILFLDEPTSGLDPESILSVNNMIKNLAKQNGVTVFLCTHQLRYAQELCTSYGLIDEGRMFASGTLTSLRQKVASGIRVDIKSDYMPDTIPFTKLDDMNYQFMVEDENKIPDIIKEIVNHGGNIFHVSIHEQTLEEIYFSLLDIYRKEGGEDHA